LSYKVPKEEIGGTKTILPQQSNTFYNDENVDPAHNIMPDIDKIHVEIAEKLFGLDAREGENFDDLRDRYAESLREELEEELRRDLELNDEDEDDFFDVDAMEQPEPRPLREPFS